MKPKEHPSFIDKLVLHVLISLEFCYCFLFSFLFSLFLSFLLSFFLSFFLFFFPITKTIGAFAQAVLERSSIGRHFWVVVNLIVRTRLSAKLFHVKIGFICTWLKTNFHCKNVALNLAFILRFKATGKWLIECCKTENQRHYPKANRKLLSTGSIENRSKDGYSLIDLWLVLEFWSSSITFDGFHFGYNINGKHQTLSWSRTFNFKNPL